MKPQDRIVVALDVERMEDAERLVERLMPLGIRRFKIGHPLFTLTGPSAVDMVHKHGGQVFLDLKFHDIPNTVAHAIQAVCRLGVWMTNLHIQGGTAMMRKAVSARRCVRQGSAPLLIGVTVLTSMSDRDLADLGVRKTLKDQVLYLAKLAQSAGLDGIVASAHEAQVIRWACGEGFLIVTPGIRPRKDPLAYASGDIPSQSDDDQKRTAFPAQAIQAGATYLVVGRPIVEAQDPEQAAKEILAELNA